jgi:antitoxin component of RelBE/YafQ-DinJ toxin-antitoxin module
MTKKETVSIRMDAGVWKEVKMLAVEKDMKISDLVETLLLNSIKQLKGR